MGVSDYSWVSCPLPLLRYNIFKESRVGQPRSAAQGSHGAQLRPVRQTHYAATSGVGALFRRVGLYQLEHLELTEQWQQHWWDGGPTRAPMAQGPTPPCVDPQRLFAEMAASNDSDSKE